MQTEIAPLLIMSKLEQFDYAGATALALVMLVVSFTILIAINSLTWRSARRRPERGAEPATSALAPAAVAPGGEP